MPPRHWPRARLSQFHDLPHASADGCCPPPRIVLTTLELANRLAAGASAAVVVEINSQKFPELELIRCSESSRDYRQYLGRRKGPASPSDGIPWLRIFDDLDPITASPTRSARSSLLSLLCQGRHHLCWFLAATRGSCITCLCKE